MDKNVLDNKCSIHHQITATVALGVPHGNFVIKAGDKTTLKNNNVIKRRALAVIKTEQEGKLEREKVVNRDCCGNCDVAETLRVRRWGAWPKNPPPKRRPAVKTLRQQQHLSWVWEAEEGEEGREIEALWVIHSKFTGAKSQSAQICFLFGNYRKLQAPGIYSNSHFRWLGWQEAALTHADPI